MSVRSIGLIFIFYSLSAQAEMGFIDEAEAPPVIKEAAASVVQVIMPEGRIIERYTQADYSSPEFERKLAGARAYYKYQMRFCKEHNLDLCLIHNGYAMASGFVVRDSHHVATNRHVLFANIQALIGEYMKLGHSYEEAYQKAFARPFMIKVARNLKLIDVGGREVVGVNWFKDESLYSLAMIDHDAFADFLGSDVLIVKTQNDIGLKPLRFAEAAPAVGERLFVLGFPQTTTDRLRAFGKGDANGIRQLSISSGVRVSFEESFARLSVVNGKLRSAYEKALATPELHKAWNDNVLLSDADSDSGSSGGPVLNENGEVVGIQVARLVEYRGAEPGLSFTFASVLVDEFAREPKLKLTE